MRTYPGSSTVVTTIFVVIVLAAASATARDVIPLPSDERGFISPPSSRASCILSRSNGYAYSYFPYWMIGDAVATLIDPVECGSAPTYPFEISTVFLSLYGRNHYGWVVWPVTMDFVVYDAVQYISGEDDTCWQIGDELCRQIAVCDEANFSYPTAGAVDFADPCCVYKPFFISAEYVSGTWPLPSLVWDYQLPDTCHAWVNMGYWEEQFEAWIAPVPGYNLIWVQGETESPNCGPSECPYPILSADFNSDVVDMPPDLSLPGDPVGDYLVIDDYYGRVLVRSAVGTLIDMPIESIHDSSIGGVDFYAYPAAHQLCDSIKVSWSSLTRSDDYQFNRITLRGPSSEIITNVAYRGSGVLTYNNDGDDVLPVTYTPDVGQDFEILVNFDAQVTRLTIDGSPVATHQAVPFFHSTSDLGYVATSAQGQQAMALDNLEVCSFCPLPADSGACCYPDGDCYYVTQEDCSVGSGTYMGDDIPCEPDPCLPAPYGACCDSVGDCHYVTEEECDLMAGYYMGDDIPCEPNPCSLSAPSGACCDEVGDCHYVTEAECDIMAGNYLGDNIPCEPNPCSLSTPFECPNPLLLADFNSDVVDMPPDLSLPGDPIGDYLYVDDSYGRALVRSAVGTLTDMPIELLHDSSIGSVKVSAFAAAHELCDSIKVSWSSLTRSSEGQFNDIVLWGPSSQIITTLSYRADGEMTYNNDGDDVLPVTYTPDVGQDFEILVNFDAQVTRLTIDGSPVASHQAVPFFHSTSDLGYVSFSTQWQQAMAFDDLEVCSFCVLPADSGACCDSVGNCYYVTEAVCDIIAGTYMGNDIPCDPNPCLPTPSGACCDSVANCFFVTEEECDLMAGTYMGDDIPCVPNPCSLSTPSGACCDSVGDCYYVTEAECDLMAGNYIGDDIPCEPNPCSSSTTRWTFHFVDVDAPGGTLTVWGTIDCDTIGGPIYDEYAVMCSTYSGTIPSWANDLLMRFAWDYVCNNVDWAKYTAPEYVGGQWILENLDNWYWENVDFKAPLQLPSIGDRTGLIQNVYYVIDLPTWYADQREPMPEYEIVDGMCPDLPGFLIGTTPIIFDPDAPSEGSPFATTPITGTLTNDGELGVAVTSCCTYRGDINHDGLMQPDIADLVYLVTFMFQDGPPPVCDEAPATGCPNFYYSEADINGDGTCVPDIADLVYLVTYMFQDGPALVPCP